MKERVIDMVTHELSASHIIENLLSLLLDKPDVAVYVLVDSGEANLMEQRIRVSITNHYNRNKIARPDRIGIRCSEPFRWTDESNGRVHAIVVRPYFSRVKTMARSLSNLNLESL